MTITTVSSPIYQRTVISSDGVNERDFTPEQIMLTYYYDTEHIVESVNSGRFVPGLMRINPYVHFRRGQIPSSDLIIKNRYYQSGVFYKAKYYRGDIAKAAFGNYQPLGLQTLPPNTEDITLQKAIAKVGGPVLEMGVELGELRETISMLRSPFKSLRTFMLKKNNRNLTNLAAVYRKVRGKGTGVPSGKLALEFGDAIANSWLELRYGLRPLISSIMGIADEVQKKKKAFYPETIKTCHATYNRTQSINEVEDKSVLDPSLRCKRKCIGYSANRCRASVMYKRDRGPTTAEQYGLALKYVPELIWELTRASFVVDWVFSVGPWLGTCRLDPSIHILGNTVSRKFEHNWHGTVESFYNIYGRPVEVAGNSTIYNDDQEYQRIVNWPVPKSPIYKGNEYLSLAKEIDMAAIILQPVISGLRKELRK